MKINIQAVETWVYAYNRLTRPAQAARNCEVHSRPCPGRLLDVTDGIAFSMDYSAHN